MRCIEQMESRCSFLEAYLEETAMLRSTIKRHVCNAVSPYASGFRPPGGWLAPSIHTCGWLPLGALRAWASAVQQRKKTEELEAKRKQVSQQGSIIARTRGASLIRKIACEVRHQSHAATGRAPDTDGTDE
eukprot:gnl/TRDRNA2_/TRDRNA2_165949_c0_seq3.p1 gnl/TRDRNA2_/TRDRNA2_165949_c0~~gnl/TRDRNA2_/TRDRNA2_165949_c0_seq3.p1  ORF type:complete len:131 (+),score=17.39 gnl/TRDRNA2_/TRDRNA2_165949_c0_seq3:203-595(+)